MIDLYQFVSLPISIASLIIAVSVAIYHWRVDRLAKLSSFTIEVIGKLYNKNEKYKKVFYSHNVDGLDECDALEILFDIELLSALANRNKIDIDLFINISGDDLVNICSNFREIISAERRNHVYGKHLYAEMEKFMGNINLRMAKRKAQSD